MRLRNHLTGDSEYCKSNSGVGAYPNVPAGVATEFCGTVRAELAEKQRVAEEKRKGKRVQEEVKARRRMQAQQQGKQPADEDQAAVGVP